MAKPKTFPTRQDYERAYYKAHKAEYANREKKWSARNRGKRVQFTMKWRSKNSARHKAYQKIWRDKNKALIEAKRATPEAKAKMAEYSRLHYRRNKTKVYLKVLRRRRLLCVATRNLKAIEAWQTRQRAKDTFVCYWCDNRFDIKELHFDHIIPIIRGGMHSPENLCTSCAGCNWSKASKLPRLWIKRGQQIMEL